MESQRRVQEMDLELQRPRDPYEAGHEERMAWQMEHDLVHGGSETRHRD